jgi:cytochrome c551/c552
MMAVRMRSVAAAACAVVALALVAHEVNAGPAGGRTPAQGAAPIVRITAPANGSAHDWNSLVSYGVVVSYDGKSTRYQEIPSREVLLTTTYVADLSSRRSKRVASGSPAGLLDIVDSNCLGCHAFKARAMGPSFAAIAAHYPHSPQTVDRLSRHIRDGSTGVWGPGSMPPHMGLTNAQLRAIVLWIMKDGADPGVNYYVGTQGAIRMQPVGTPGPRAGLVITACYSSPSAAAGSRRPAYGEDTVILRGR